LNALESDTAETCSLGENFIPIACFVTHHILRIFHPLLSLMLFSFVVSVPNLNDSTANGHYLFPLGRLSSFFSRTGPTSRLHCIALQNFPTCALYLVRTASPVFFLRAFNATLSPLFLISSSLPFLYCQPYALSTDGDPTQSLNLSALAPSHDEPSNRTSSGQQLNYSTARNQTTQFFEARDLPISLVNRVLFSNRDQPPESRSVPD
jgi:hypothetical protein